MYVCTCVRVHVRTSVGVWVCRRVVLYWHVHMYACACVVMRVCACVSVWRGPRTTSTWTGTGPLLCVCVCVHVFETERIHAGVFLMCMHFVHVVMLCMLCIYAYFSVDAIACTLIELRDASSGESPELLLSLMISAKNGSYGEPLSVHK